MQRDMRCQYSTDKKFKKGVKVKKANAKTTKVTLTKLTKGKKYYVRVRAYRVDEDDNRVNGSWSEAKSSKDHKNKTARYKWRGRKTAALFAFRRKSFIIDTNVAQKAENKGWKNDCFK